MAKRSLSCALGWTLIELIGMLAVTAILFAAVVPVLMHQLDRAAANLEASRLREFRHALQDQIQRIGTIPDAQGVFAVVAPALGRRTADLATNTRGLARAIVWDPRLQIGPATNRTLPFVQSALGSLAPTFPRLVMLSSLGEPLPAGLTNGAILTAAAFEAIWQTAPKQIPSGWDWSGRGEDLWIERCDLTDLFLPIAFNNHSSTNAQWSVSTSSVAVIGPGVFSSFFLRATPLELRDERGQLQSTEVIQTPQGWCYAAGKWQRNGSRTLPPETPRGWEFAELTEVFRLAPPNPSSPSGSLDRTLRAMTNFCQAYAHWAAGGFGSLTLDAPVALARQELDLATRDLLLVP